MVYKFFNKNFWGEIVKKDNISDKELAEESHKLIIVWKKNYNIFQTARFNHTMIFFKLTD